MINIENKISRISEELKKWEVPSCALTVVKDGEILYAGGIGSRDNGSNPATGKTLYQIASCSKAFTATLAGVLATEGILDFDTPVKNYMPDFQLADEFATNNLTVRDFLCHRSGLPRHEMAWYGSGYTRDELMSNLKYLPLNQSPRYKFQYCNFNYLIVGVLIERLTGMKFEDAMFNKLLRPIGMTQSHVYLDEIESQEDHALPYDRPEEYTMTGCKQIPYYVSPAEVHDADNKVGDPTAPAGCIVSCAEDMAQWLLFNLNKGKVGDKQLVREDLMELIRTMHMTTGDDPSTPEISMGSYGLGWSIQSYRGYKLMEHGGNVNGFTSSTSFVPDRNLGIFVSCNMNVALIAEAIYRDILDDDLEAGDADWYNRQWKLSEEMFAHVKVVLASFAGTPIAGTKPSHDLADYAGIYEAPGYKRFAIRYTDGKLEGDFNTFFFGLDHFHYDTFAADASLGEFPAGATMTFAANPEGKISTLTIMLGTEQNLKPIVFTKQ